VNRKLIILLSLGFLPFISVAATPTACELLTAKDASTLAGQALSAVPNSAPTSCRYHGAGGPGALGVEIHVKVVSDAAAAHAQFPRWVVPYPGAAGPTVTDVKNVGDEAAIVRSAIMSGINFRRGAVLIKIGVHPPANDDAVLKAAAAAVVGRL
jgi:hypothetical protein